MTLEQAFEHFMKTEVFREQANQKGSPGSKIRGYATRFKQGKLKEKAIIKILSENGYTIKKNIVVHPPK